MAKIEIPEKYEGKMGKPGPGDLYMITVKLKNGEKYKKLACLGRTITGYLSDPNGESDLDFETEDIEEIKEYKPFIIRLIYLIIVFLLLYGGFRLLKWILF